MRPGPGRPRPARTAAQATRDTREQGGESRSEASGARASTARAARGAGARCGALSEGGHRQVRLRPVAQRQRGRPSPSTGAGERGPQDGPAKESHHASREVATRAEQTARPSIFLREDRQPQEQDDRRRSRRDSQSQPGHERTEAQNRDPGPPQDPPPGPAARAPSRLILIRHFALCPELCRRPHVLRIPFRAPIDDTEVFTRIIEKLEVTARPVRS